MPLVTRPYDSFGTTAQLAGNECPDRSSTELIKSSPSSSWTLAFLKECSRVIKLHSSCQSTNLHSSSAAKVLELSPNAALTSILSFLWVLFWFAVASGHGTPSMSKLGLNNQKHEISLTGGSRSTSTLFSMNWIYKYTTSIWLLLVVAYSRVE